ncbi:Rhodanese-related sulfurtransferase [Fibrobacter sp. UWR3]|uniref:rhodanese-like domain-containing protein n=1 Tax=unclassified Fibrobacter TaxID=2634177 RepID=UPI0009208D85|nr:MULTISPECIES: rhodanese-like domain-containing protein [unclassified Fibrobacter]SHM95292.1 Rhodanese-related sulfurtransferase [Fibrobacter sp. UWR3]
MKKLFGLVICSAFMLCACNEANAEKSATAKGAPAAQPAAAVAAPKPAESAPAPEAPKAQITNIDWAKALEMQKAGGVLIDVRTPGEVAEGTAPGSINIPLQEAEQRLAEFPKDKDLLIFCRSGKRSMAVSNILIQNGYERVFNVVGGFMAFPKN